MPITTRPDALSSQSRLMTSGLVYYPGGSSKTLITPVLIRTHTQYTTLG